MSSRDFYDSTPYDLMLRIEGWREMQDIEQQITARNFRQLAYCVLPGGHWKKGYIPDLSKMWPLPEDKKEQPLDDRPPEQIRKEKAEKLWKRVKAWGVKVSESQKQILIEEIGQEAKDYYTKKAEN